MMVRKYACEVRGDRVVYEEQEEVDGKWCPYVSHSLDFRTVAAMAHALREHIESVMPDELPRDVGDASLVGELAAASEEIARLRGVVTAYAAHTDWRPGR